MKRKALKAAFPHTIPIFTGFFFLVAAYGIYMSTSGFSEDKPMPNKKRKPFAIIAYGFPSAYFRIISKCSFAKPISCTSSSVPI